MSHVDDGRLHAYLDGALPGGSEERRTVEAHLGLCPDCRARLEAAREDREKAGEILALLNPEAVHAPPFEELVARKEPTSAPPDSAGPRRGLRAWIPLAWAATVILALGGGWMARGTVLPSGAEDPTTAPTAQTARAPTPVPDADEVRAPERAPAEWRPATAAEAPTRPPAEAEPVQEVAPPETALVAEQISIEAAPEEDLPHAGSTHRARALEELTARATADEAWSTVTPAEAARELGRPALELEDLPWDRMELARVADWILVRTMHPVEPDERVELVQAIQVERLAEPALDAPSEDTSAILALNRVVADRAVRTRLREDVALAPATYAPPESEAEAARGAVLAHAREGLTVLLRGLDDLDALEELLARLR